MAAAIASIPQSVSLSASAFAPLGPNDVLTGRLGQTQT